jgi:sporulation protein YlmC with PRC-barrel domain
MIKHVMTSTALAFALLVPNGAFAQTQTGPSAAAMSDAHTQQQPGEYMAGNIIGTKVRNAQDESIGSVSDLVIDQSGKVKTIIVSVGGFLGIGDKHVAVPWDQFQVRADASGAGSTGATTGTGGTAAASRDPALIVNMTKDQLKAAPEFKTLAQQSRDAPRTAPSGAPTAPGTAPRTTPAN